MIQYSLTEAKAKFAEVVAKAAAGEEITVTRMGKPAVKIIPATEKEAGSRIGFLKGRLYIAEDFDELPDEIARAFGVIE